tara:strand:- start:355 stop:1026 length:672 start_codon:yes stop_codon:yes gene_type:complete
MADKTMGATDFLMFQTLLNQMKQAGGPTATFNRSIYGLFPKTAMKAAGIPMGAGVVTPLSQQAVAAGASGVGRMVSARLPLIQGGLQVLSGDPIGGVGTAGGGFLGAKAGAALGAPFGPVGVLAGGLIGGLAGGAAGQSVTRGIAGIDVNNPLTGPDLSLAGIPLSQYAKTKKSLERATELEKKRYQELAPLYEKARNQQMARDMISSQMGLASTMLGSVYGR